MTKDGIKINTKANHLFVRVQQRGVSHNKVLRTLKEPEAISTVKKDKISEEPSVAYITKDSYVAMNPLSGKIITTWKLNEKGFKRYKKAFQNENKTN